MERLRASPQRLPASRRGPRGDRSADYYDRLSETDVFEELALFNQRGVTLGTNDGAHTKSSAS